MSKPSLPLGKATENPLDRRAAETARKARIFNTRLRVMGIDIDALNKQVEEKKHRQDTEMQLDKTFDKMGKHHNFLLLQQDTDERNKRAALHTDLAHYWATHQRVEDSRDADLKCGLKGAPRITIPESELGPASMQIFQGEGIGEEEKKREQTKETERDLQAQKEDNERSRMRQKHRDMLVSKDMVHQDLQGVQMCTLEEECKRAARIALDSYNQDLAALQAEKLKEEHRREERENLAEMLHIMTSNMMIESSEAAKVGLGGGKPRQVLVDRWKGMSPEQLSAIHRENQDQRVENQTQRDAAKAQDKARELQLLKLSREAEEEEKRRMKLRREKRIQIDCYNMQLAKQQQENQNHLNKTLYTNKPTKDYFNQFNTSSR